MVGTTVGGAHIATVYKDGFIIYDTYQLSYSVLYFIVTYHCTTATILLVTYQSHSQNLPLVFLQPILYHYPPLGRYRLNPVLHAPLLLIERSLPPLEGTLRSPRLYRHCL